jgi:hypothetical protein
MKTLIAGFILALGLAAPGCGTSESPRPQAGPSLRFGTATRGCSNAYVVSENAEGTEVLAVTLARDHVPLTTKARTFQIEERPEGLNVAVLVYPERPTITTHCSDVVPSRPPQRTRWTASRGRVTASISEAAPKPGQCYKIDVRLEDVVFADDDREVTLPSFEFRNVGVGHLPPMSPCP